MKMAHRSETIDGNEAAARIAYATKEMIAIYPITPASPMGELSDSWAASGKENAFGSVPQVIEMQSEGGAAGALHGALQGGALATTFTTSQGLLLMIPNMFEIAGELTSTVIHVAARSVATHALSIFGDHSDVMATRSTGFAMLCSSSVQEAQDFALIAQAATLRSRVPFLHFFDGFRTSHEINEIDVLSDDSIRSMIDRSKVDEHRNRSLDPDRPVLRGSAQNPDVFFQAREAINPHYASVAEIVRSEMDRFDELTGRSYQPFDYYGAPDASRVIVMMGSGIGAAEEAIDALTSAGEKVGLVKVRLYRPFDGSRFVAALPATTQRVAVLDRTKEPGSIGEPLYQDVVTAITEASYSSDRPKTPRIVGGRYGLASKEFTPAMAMAVFDNLAADEPKQHFTIGIHDDVSLTSLAWNDDGFNEGDDVTRAVFYGLGSDGTVSANKNSVKIIGENTPHFSQGYFVYDSKKAGSTTVSHLRFSQRPIRSTYLIRQANFVACHQFDFMRRMDVLEIADQNATFLLNSPYAADEVWDQLTAEVQQQIIGKQLQFYVVDARRIARDHELGGHINTVMQSCFFALSGVLPKPEAFQQIKASAESSYGKRGPAIVERNLSAITAAFDAAQQVAVPARSKEVVKHKAIDMLPKQEHLEQERVRFEYFESLPDADRNGVKSETVKGSQLLLPLFEYSGACAGCGETPYLKLMSQLFGDRMIVANATGCSSIFGGNLPTTPWTKNGDGRGPAWSNSLFEDNAEFGLGIRMALDGKQNHARAILSQLSGEVGQTLADAILVSDQQTESQISEQRNRIERLKEKLSELDSTPAKELASIADALVTRSLWIVGGDGWAYDIGYGGLDHVLASGRDVNILVLDTGVYSNTGGQASKATPRAATAKFAANGRDVHRKDLGMMAAAYGSVYVAQVAIGANPAQTVRAFHEAESYRGPSLILAYSQCIAHGIDMSTGMTHQRELVRSGFWPLYRYDPRNAHEGTHPFHLDSHKPSLKFQDVAMKEARFAMLARTQPDRARDLLELAQKDIDDTWHYYEQMAGVEREFADLPDTEQASP